MTVINPCGWLQNAGSTHTAEQMRNFVYLPSDILSAGLLPKGGVDSGKGSKLKVTQTGSPSMAVIVGSGHAIVAGTESTKQGGYGVLNDADFSITITAAHATLNRIDIIVFKVEDSQYSGGANTSSLVVVDGTPASSPSPPTAPVNSITLAQIFVGAAVTTIVNANITDTRKFLGTGIFQVNVAGDLPAAGIAGRYRDRLDTGALERDNGSAWVSTTVNVPAMNVQVFTSGGTWTKPADAKSVRARVQAGGGAGGGAPVATPSGQHTKGGGGGGGGYAEFIGAAAALGSTVSITIGAGGTGVSGGTGNTGGTSSFGTHAVAAGGVGGSFTTTSVGVFSAVGGAGGGASAGTVMTVGGAGDSGTGGGGLGAGGSGGEARLGGGAKGTATFSAGAEVAGVVAGNYGGGGGGGAGAGISTAVAGGAGGPGIIIVETWF